MATERAFVADHLRLRLAARTRHDELRNRRSLRPHGAEAKHRATAGCMPVAGPVLLVVTIPGHRNVMRMGCRSGSVIVLMRIAGPIALMVAQHRYVEGDRDRERRCHRREQISDGDKPSPPSSPWLSQANHPCTCCLDREHIALVAVPANRKRRTRHRPCTTGDERRAPCRHDELVRASGAAMRRANRLPIFLSSPVIYCTHLRRSVECVNDASSSRHL